MRRWWWSLLLERIITRKFAKTSLNLIWFSRTHFVQHHHEPLLSFRLIVYLTQFLWKSLKGERKFNTIVLNTFLNNQVKLICISRVCSEREIMWEAMKEIKAVIKYLIKKNCRQNYDLSFPHQFNNITSFEFFFFVYERISCSERNSKVLMQLRSEETKTALNHRFLI
jgi:hypothetical protein